MIEISKLNFAYQLSPVLTDISLVFKPKEFVAETHQRNIVASIRGNIAAK